VEKRNYPLFLDGHRESLHLRAHLQGFFSLSEFATPINIDSRPFSLAAAPTSVGSALESRWLSISDPDDYGDEWMWMRSRPRARPEPAQPRGRGFSSRAP